MRTYSFGVETVPVAMANDLLVGSVHDGRNYRIMLAKLKNGEIVKTRFLAGENGWVEVLGMNVVAGVTGDWEMVIARLSL